MVPSLRRLAHLLAAMAALVFSAAIPPASALAQTPEVAVSDTVLEVRLEDGSVLVGRVVAVDRERGLAVIATEGGARVEVPLAQIRSVRPARGGVRTAEAEAWPEDPDPTRLFFAPTGRTPPAGRGSFGVIELFFPNVTYGVVNGFSVTAGTVVIPEDLAEFVFVIPKVRLVDTDRAQVAVGLLGILADDDFDSTRGVAFVTGTFGPPDAAFTLGAGVPVISSDGASGTGEPVLLMAGGERRVGRGVKLLTENYFSPGASGAILSAGFRFFGERLSADVGVATIAGGDGDDGCCLPLVSVSYAFGGRRR